MQLHVNVHVHVHVLRIKVEVPLPYEFNTTKTVAFCYNKIPSLHTKNILTQNFVKLTDFILSIVFACEGMVSGTLMKQKAGLIRSVNEETCLALVKDQLKIQAIR